MGKLGRLWKWLLNPDNRATVGLIGSGIAAIMVGAWALYLHLSKPPTPEFKQPLSGIVAGRDVVAGRDINIINQNYPLEQFEKLLKERNKDILDKIAQADPEQRALFNKELAAIKAKYDNLQKAYEEQKARLAEASKAIEDFKRDFPPEQLQRARKALAQGDVGAAEGLFRRALEKGTEQAEKGNKQAAEAAYHLGMLAESRIDYGQADKYYRQAVQLQPDNSRYLNAAGLLSYTLGRYQEGEKFLQLALELREKSLNPEHPDVAQSLNNLAELYRAQGKYGEAEPLCKRAWPSGKRPWGLSTRSWPTASTTWQGYTRPRESMLRQTPLYQRALAIVEKILKGQNTSM